MADQTLGRAVLRTELDLAGLTSGLRQVRTTADTALRGVEDRAKQSGRNIGRSLVQGFEALGQMNLRNLLGTGGVVYGLVQLEREAFQSNTALRLLENQWRRNNINFAEGRAELDQLADELRVMPSTLADNVAQLLRTGLSMEEVTAAFRAGAASALAFGKTSAEGIENVSGAIITGRSTLLDSIGIAQNLDNAYKEYATTLGKTTEQLNNTERAQAAVQLVTRYTKEEVEDLPILLSGFGGAMSDLSRAGQELRVTLGNDLMPTVTNVTEGLVSVLDIIKGLPEPVRRFGVYATVAATGVSLLGGAVTVLKVALGGLAGPAGIILAVAAAVGGLAGILTTGGGGQPSLEQALKDVSVAASDTAALEGFDLTIMNLANNLTGPVKAAFQSARDDIWSIVSTAESAQEALARIHLGASLAEQLQGSDLGNALEGLIVTSTNAEGQTVGRKPVSDLRAALVKGDFEQAGELIRELVTSFSGVADGPTIEKLGQLLGEVQGAQALIDQLIAQQNTPPGGAGGGGGGSGGLGDADDIKKETRTLDDAIQEFGRKGAALNREAAAYVAAGISPVETALGLLRDKVNLGRGLVEELVRPVEEGGFGLPSDAPEVQFVTAKIALWEEAIKNLQALTEKMEEAVAPPRARKLSIRPLVEYLIPEGSIAELERRATALEQAIQIEPDPAARYDLALDLQDVNRQIEAAEAAFRPRPLKLEAEVILNDPDPEEVQAAKEFFQGLFSGAGNILEPLGGALENLQEWGAASRVVDQLRVDLERVDTIAGIFGETGEELAQKQTLVRRAIETLVGMGPRASAFIRTLTGEYEDLGDQMEAVTRQANQEAASREALRRILQSHAGPGQLAEARDERERAEQARQLTAAFEARTRVLNSHASVQAQVNELTDEYAEQVERLQRTLRSRQALGLDLEPTLQQMRELDLKTALEELDRVGAEGLSNFAKAVLTANGVLQETPDFLLEVAEAQDVFTSAWEEANQVLDRAPSKLDLLIEKLTELVAGDNLNPEQLETAKGLLEDLLNLQAENRTAEELDRIADMALDALSALDDLVNIDWSSGNSILEGLTSSIGTVVGMIPGLGAVGDLITQIGSALSSVLGDMRNGMAEVQEETENIQEGFDLIDISSLIQTKQVNRGGLLGLLGLTYTAVDEEASALGLSIAEAIEGGVLSGLRNGLDRFLETGDITDLEFALQEGIYAGVTDALMAAIVEQGIIQSILGPKLLELTKAIAEGYETGNYSAALGILADIQAMVPQIAAELAPIFAELRGLKPEAPAGEGPNIGGGGRQISEITGPTRDLLTDLLTPLASLVSVPSLLQAQLRVQEDILNFIALGVEPGTPITPIFPRHPQVPAEDDPRFGRDGGPSLYINELNMTTDAKNARQLYRDLSDWHSRQARGRRR